VTNTARHSAARHSAAARRSAAVRHSALTGALIVAGLLAATTFAVGPTAGVASPAAVHVAIQTGSAVASGVASELETAAATKAKKKAKKKVGKEVGKRKPKKRAASKPASKPVVSRSLSTPAPATGSTTVVAPTALESRIVELTNAQRAANGCGPLRIDGALTQAARAHSSDMATNNYFDHTGRDGSTFTVRAARAGYSQASAENIAWGYRTADAVVTGWMNSEGHRRNILNCASVAVGVGVATEADGTPYYTQIFGRA
jgi:uncharacterized protein YkwD